MSHLALDLHLQIRKPKWIRLKAVLVQKDMEAAKIKK